MLKRGSWRLFGDSSIGEDKTLPQHSTLSTQAKVLDAVKDRLRTQAQNQQNHINIEG